MNLLLDTHTFLWYYSGSAALSSNAIQAIDDPTNDFFVSVVSLWEISIKHSLGKLELDHTLTFFFEDIVNKGFKIMPLDIIHILQTSTLPFHHRDPFDRILIGQAIAENMVIITRDSLFEPYRISTPLRLLW